MDEGTVGKPAGLQKGVCMREKGSRQGRATMREVPASGLLCMLVWGRIWHWGSGTDSREPCPRPASKPGPSRRGARPFQKGRVELEQPLVV